MRSGLGAGDDEGRRVPNHWVSTAANAKSAKAPALLRRLTSRTSERGSDGMTALDGRAFEHGAPRAAIEILNRPPQARHRTRREGERPTRAPTVASLSSSSASASALPRL